MAISCDDMTARVGETRNDSFGGKFELVAVGGDLSSVLATITTPWGDKDSLIEIDKGETKEYIEDNIAYSINVKDIFYQFNTYVCAYEVCVEELPEPAGLLVCNSSPEYAEIWINGSNTGEYTPRSFPNTDVGNYTILFRKEGYKDCSVNVTVVANGSVNAFCSLIEDVTTGDLSCVTTPTGANIYLNDVYSGVSNSVIYDLEPGNYTIRFELDGYEIYETAKTVEIGEIVYVNATLFPIVLEGFIRCEAYIDGTNTELNASIQIDGNSIVPKTPHTTIGLSPGNHTITFILDGYNTQDITVAVVAGETVDAIADMIEIPTTGSILCTTFGEDNKEISGAKIFLNTAYTGQVTPYTLTNLNPGFYKINHEKDGYTGCWEDNVEVKVGMVSGVSCTLVLIPTTGSLSITSEPIGAAIWLDSFDTGQFTSSLPVIITDLVPGTHTIVFKKSGYNNCTVQQDVISGTTRYVHCDLVEEDTFTSLSIGVIPSEIGVGQYSEIRGGMYIEDAGLILPGLLIKLYIDKGSGFVHIATTNTPTDGTGLFNYEYLALQEDVGKTLKFKYVYEGNESLKLAASESLITSLTVQEEAILIETKIELSASPSINATPTTIVELTAYLTDIDNNPLPNGSFVNFYKDDEFIVTSGTIDGYAYYDYPSIVEDSLQTIVFNTEYLGIENTYDGSENSINVTFKEYIPIKECIQHLTQQECEDNDCYWWSDNTCQSAPEGTTEYFDVYVKPFSWYEGRYEDALNTLKSLVTGSVDMGGKIKNYMESIIGVTGIEYKGIDILEDQNKNILIIRIYLKDINTTTLAIPLLLLPYLPEIVLIITALLAVALIGVITGTSDEGFTKEEVAKDVIGEYYLEDVIGCLQNYLDINREEATEFLNCLDIAQENNEATNNCYITLLNDYGFDIESPEAKDKVLNFLICMKVTEETKGIIGDDIFDDPTWTNNAEDNIANLDELINDLENGDITPKEALDGGNETKNESEDVTNDTASDYGDDNCVFDIAGQCILTKEGLNTLVLIGAGAAALIAYSAIKK